MDSLFTVFNLLACVLSLRTSSDTTAPLDYLVGAEVGAQKYFIELYIEGEYEREQGFNYWNTEGLLDLRYARGEYIEQNARGLSTQKVILKYPASCSLSVLHFETDAGVTSLWEHWEEYKGIASYSRLKISVADKWFLEWKGTFYIDRRPEIHGSCFSAGVWIAEHLSLDYQVVYQKEKPLFQWLIFKIGLLG